MKYQETTCLQSSLHMELVKQFYKDDKVKILPIWTWNRQLSVTEVMMNNSKYIITEFFILFSKL
jgi:hypothetical protein